MPDIPPKLDGSRLKINIVKPDYDDVRLAELGVAEAWGKVQLAMYQHDTHSVIVRDRRHAVTLLLDALDVEGHVNRRHHRIIKCGPDCWVCKRADEGAKE